MVTSGNLDFAALRALAGNAELFNALDTLRQLGVDKELSLPQLIVVGDQSSGKSSVLEAIAGEQFPVSAKLCTKFPIELVLRRVPETGTQASIFPGKHRSVLDAARLRCWRRNLRSDAIDLPELITEAATAMGLDTSNNKSNSNPRDGATARTGNTFSDDVLRIQVDGPDRLPLTLVDLPGLFQSTTSQQREEDRNMVENIVQRYIANERSVILLVVSLQTPYANHKAPEVVGAVDPEGRRTLGILTSPDSAKDEDEVFEVMANKVGLKLKLGWHCLRNRSPVERDDCVDRNKNENSFFRTVKWEKVPEGEKGIASLKDKLHNLLAEIARNELPLLKRAVDERLKMEELVLKRIRTPRNTESDQRRFLCTMAATFEKVANAAVKGEYKDYDCKGFFEARGDDEGCRQCKRLQATVREMNRLFFKAMFAKGKASLISTDESNSRDSFYASSLTSSSGVEYRRLYEGIKASQRWERGDGDTEASEEAAEYNTFLPQEIQAQYEKPPFPRRVTQEDSLEEATDLNKKFLGCDSRLDVNPLAVRQLFQQESKPWIEITKMHLEIVRKTVTEFVSMALDHSVGVDQTLLEALRARIVDPRLKSLWGQVENQFEDLLRCHQGNNMGFHDALIELIGAPSPDSLAEKLSEMISIEDSLVEDDPQMSEVPEAPRKHVSEDEEELGPSGMHDTFKSKTSIQETTRRILSRRWEALAALRVIESEEFGYNVSLISFVGNVSSLIVGGTLLRKLCIDIFSQDVVWDTPVEIVREIAGEREADAQRRGECQGRIEDLRRVLKVFEKVRGGMRFIRRTNMSK